MWLERAYLFSFTLEKVEFATYMNFPVQGKLWFEIESGRLELFFVVTFCPLNKTGNRISRIKGSIENYMK